MGRPETGSAFGYVHNRLLTLLLFDIGSFAGLAALLNSAVVAARRDDPWKCRISVRPIANRVMSRRPRVHNCSRYAASASPTG